MYNDPYKNEKELREIREKLAKGEPSLGESYDEYREKLAELNLKDKIARILFLAAAIGLFILIALTFTKHGNLPE